MIIDFDSTLSKHHIDGVRCASSAGKNLWFSFSLSNFHKFINSKNLNAYIYL